MHANQGLPVSGRHAALKGSVFGARARRGKVDMPASGSHGLPARSDPHLAGLHGVDAMHGMLDHVQRQFAHRRRAALVQRAVHAVRLLVLIHRIRTI